MAVNAHRTLSPDLFSCGMVQCGLGVSLQNSKMQGSIFLWTWQLGPKGKAVFFHCESWIVPTSNLTEKHTSWFFSLLQQLLWSSFFFFKQTNKKPICLPFLSGKSSDCSFSPIHGCLRFCLYTTLKQLGNLLLLTLEMWPRAKKKIFFACGNWTVMASNLPEKHTHIPFFGQVFVF